MNTNRLPAFLSGPFRTSRALFLFLALGFGGCKKDPAPAPGGATRPQAPARPTTEQKALAKFDADKDGALSKNEREKMNNAFVEHFDTDGDKRLSEEEKATARRRSKVTVVPSNPRTTTLESAAAFLGRFDTDGDGKVSAAEAGETRWKVMSRSDTNKDGLISSPEWYAANYRRQKAQARQRKPPQAK